eukprot:TRINITY_DN5104_c0_g1_i1.p1 TRINITY_DN5104_c0_g1~~TRINITY_DN5104_c0_g1_i1.p1  ORF type:complete len:761 (+),score=107.30 TRINITY_DN5104_c0_g1_i1:53-2335(+)
MSASSAATGGSNLSSSGSQALPPPELVPAGIACTTEKWFQFESPTHVLNIGLSPDGKKLGVTLESKGSHFILIYNPETRQVIDTIGGSTGCKDGKFEEAQFDYCMGLDFSLDSNRLYITDYGNHKIRVANFLTREVSTVAGSSQGFEDGTLLKAKFHCPSGVRVDPASDVDCPTLLVTDYFNHALRQVDVLNNRVTTLVGAEDQESADALNDPTKPLPFDLVNPTDVVIRNDGEIFIAEYLADRITQTNRDTLKPRIVAGIAKLIGARDSFGPLTALRLPTSFCFVPVTNDIVIVDYGNHCLRLIEDVDSELPRVRTLVNPSATRGIQDGDQSTAQLTFPRTAVFLHPKTDDLVDGFTILVSDKYCIRNVRISPSEAQKYLLRPRGDAQPFSLGHLSLDDDFADTSVSLSGGGKHKIHSAILRVRCPKLFSSLRDSTTQINLTEDEFQLLMRYVYQDYCGLKKHSNFEQGEWHSSMEIFLKLIKLAQQFDLASLLTNARAGLAMLFIHAFADRPRREGFWAHLEKLTETLGLASEMDQLLTLKKTRFGLNSTTSLYSNIWKTQSLRDHVSSILRSKKLMKMADVSIVLLASTSTDSTPLPEIRAHSSVLYARSAFFRSLLSGQFRTDDQLTLELGPLAASVSDLHEERFLRAFVGIIYGDTSYVPSSIDEALLLIDRIHFYGIDDDLAVSRAQGVILKHLNVHNCLHVLKTVMDSPDLHQVRFVALSLISRNIRLLYTTLEKDSNPQILLKILLFKATYG